MSVVGGANKDKIRLFACLFVVSTVLEQLKLCDNNAIHVSDFKAVIFIKLLAHAQ